MGVDLHFNPPPDGSKRLSSERWIEIIQLINRAYRMMLVLSYGHNKASTIINDNDITRLKDDLESWINKNS